MPLVSWVTSVLKRPSYMVAVYGTIRRHGDDAAAVFHDAERGARPAARLSIAAPRVGWPTIAGSRPPPARQFPPLSRPAVGFSERGRGSMTASSAARRSSRRPGPSRVRSGSDAPSNRTREDRAGGRAENIGEVKQPMRMPAWPSAATPIGEVPQQRAPNGRRNRPARKPPRQRRRRARQMVEERQEQGAERACRHRRRSPARDALACQSAGVAGFPRSRSGPIRKAASVNTKAVALEPSR